MFARKPDYLLKVRGMSMRDAGIMDGDLLAVQKATTPRTARSSSRASATRSPSSACKRTRTGIELMPENPDFEPIVVSAGEARRGDFALEGLAVGLIRNNMLM
jgi:repressor LexA